MLLGDARVVDQKIKPFFFADFADNFSHARAVRHISPHMNHAFGAGRHAAFHRAGTADRIHLCARLCQRVGNGIADSAASARNNACTSLKFLHSASAPFLIHYAGSTIALFSARCKGGKSPQKRITVLPHFPENGGLLL